MKTIFCLMISLTAASAADLKLLPAQRSVAEITRTEAQSSAYRSWKISLAPVLASQTLDVASSYGMRELNPVLAGADGRFGAKASIVKLGVVGAVMGLEYLLVRKHPGSARILSKLNWTSAVVTTGFAAHNYAIK